MEVQFLAQYTLKTNFDSNISRKSKFVKNLINNLSLDISVEKLINFNPNISSEELKRKFKLLRQKNYKRKIHKLKNITLVLKEGIQLFDLKNIYLNIYKMKKKGKYN